MVLYGCTVIIGFVFISVGGEGGVVNNTTILQIVLLLFGIGLAVMLILAGVLLVYHIILSCK